MSGGKWRGRLSEWNNKTNAESPALANEFSSTESDLKEKVNHSPQAKLSKPDYTTSSKL
jgi:hypothetical protein